MLLPETITAAQFDRTLLCYPALLKALSASKTGTCAPLLLTLGRCIDNVAVRLS